MLEKIKTLIIQVTEDESAADNLDSETDLITDTAIDSLQFVNLILALEDEYDLEIDFDNLDIEEISIVGKLIDYIKENRNNG